MDIQIRHAEARDLGAGKALLGAVRDKVDNWLQLERVGPFVWSANARAVRLRDAFGLEVVGTLRRYVRRPGGVSDATAVGRLVPAAGSAGKLPAAAETTA